MRLTKPLAAVGLSVLAACGGGGGGGLSDLTGGWFLTPIEGAVAADPIHLTITQTGSSLSAVATCNDSFPVGSGTWAMGALSLTFDLGGGDALVLTGGVFGGGIAGTFTAPDDSGAFLLERTNVALDCAHACDPVSVEPFVGTDFTDLDFIDEISLFRSSAGHDYSDDCEDCRSMKHYFAPYAEFLANGVVPVRSPVSGQIVSVTAEGHGASPDGLNKQVRIRSAIHPEVTFILFHTDLEGGVAAGDFVAAGDAIGTARLVYEDLKEVAHDFDIAVRVHTLYGDRYVSWFDVVTDALFDSYVARGATARSDFVITNAARDADPLTCSGESFTSTGVLPAWFVLDPP